MTDKPKKRKGSPSLPFAPLEGRPTITVAGREIGVISQEEAETVDAVVCAPYGFFPDDVQAFCDWCKEEGRVTPIVHRPHVPKRPPKVCIDCAAKRSEAERRAKEGPFGGGAGRPLLPN